jgi:hypothetical protein
LKTKKKWWYKWYQRSSFLCFCFLKIKTTIVNLAEQMLWNGVKCLTASQQSWLKCDLSW